MTRKLLNAECLMRITAAIVLALGAVVLALTRHSFHDAMVRQALRFDYETDSYRAWQTNDPMLILDLYLFNWTNAVEALASNGTIRPHFRQMGPYRFWEVKEKYDVRIHDNGTVTYKFVQKYYEHPESPNSLQDRVTTINPVALTAAFKARYQNFFVKMTNNIILTMAKAELTATHTVEEWLFEGFADSVMDSVRNIPLIGNGVQNRFGWFYNKNQTMGLSGDFGMFMDQDENFGRIDHWNGRRQTQFFPGECGRLRGSSGEFHPMHHGLAPLEIYSPELCSFARLDYEATVAVKGITANKFSADTLFDNVSLDLIDQDQGTRVPEYKCFCNGGCTPSGVHNVSNCRMGSPVFLSLPHFYNADPYYTSTIDGLTPNKDDHDFYITIEPTSSIVIDLRARMQLNMLLQPISGFTLFKNVPTAYIPIFFFDQHVIVADDLAIKMILMQYLPCILLALAAIVAIVAILINLPVFRILYKAVCNPNPDPANEDEFNNDVKAVNDICLSPYEIVPLKCTNVKLDAQTQSKVE